MNIQQYAESHQSDQPKSDVVARWESRVVAQGLHLQGRAGAENYLARYGKGLGEAKALGLAAVARVKGASEMATRFLEEAFFLATGTRERLGASAVSTPATCLTSPNRSVPESYGSEPMVLTVLPESEAYALVDHPGCGLQEKIDGERSPVRSARGLVTAGNKLGLVRALPLHIADAIAGFGAIEVDAEHVAETNTLHLFDLLSIDGRDVRDLPFWKRFDLLKERFESATRPACLKLVPLITKTEEKRAFVASLKAAGAEGFVLKRLDASYESGDRHGTQFKFQFRKQLAAIVGERNGTKNSVQIHVLRSNGERRPLGSVTVPAHSIPTPGSIIEVQYLYCHRGSDGCLAQPVFLGLRHDVLPTNCTEDKLQYKRAC